MRAPVDFSQTTEPLVVEVETAAGSDEFRVDPRLRVDEVRLGCDDFLSMAALSVRLDDEFDPPAARYRYYSDHRFVIRSNQDDPQERTILLEGYPRLQESEWSGQPGRKRDEFKLEVTHVYERLSRDKCSQIFGRWMRNAQIEDGLQSDPGAWADKSVLIEALPCIFNPGGRFNCSPTPLLTTDAEGNPRTIYIFTYDNDFGAISWTYLILQR